MRVLCFLILLVPAIAAADDIVLTAPVTDVTVYADGAKITRSVALTAAAGLHQLILPDVPMSSNLQSLRVAIPGAVMGETSIRTNYVPPREALESPAFKAAEARVKELEAQLQAKVDQAALVRLAIEAASARVSFLGRLGSHPDTAAGDAEATRVFANMIQSETLAARQEALAAEIEARQIDKAQDTTRDDLNKARQALAALVPEDKDRAFVTIAMSLDAPFEGTADITYLTYGATRWQPTYEVHLDRTSETAVEIRRAAFVEQDTGENWTNINLTLSTLNLTQPLAAYPLHPQRRRIEDPDQPTLKLSRQAEADLMAGQSFAAPAIVEESMTSLVQIEGLGALYVFPNPVSVASDADVVRVTLDSLNTPATIWAQAIPRNESAAYLMATITNDTGEALLPSNSATYFVDGVVVGGSNLDMIAAGAETDLSFGPINGLVVSRATLDRNEGDRGVITRSNLESERAELKIENLTDRAWDLRVFDLVPYSEQEDLVIEWSADPRPSHVDYENQRGILMWDIPIAARETQVIRLDQSLRWPADKVLR
jgi:uncharacterized protein (TIGR02231 family)